MKASRLLRTVRAAIPSGTDDLAGPGAPSPRRVTRAASGRAHALSLSDLGLAGGALARLHSPAPITARLRAACLDEPSRRLEDCRRAGSRRQQRWTGGTQHVKCDLQSHPKEGAHVDVRDCAECLFHRTRSRGDRRRAVWSILTQHRVGGYENCRVHRRLQITLTVVPVDPPASSARRA
jgi:hypothetical protein